MHWITLSDVEQRLVTHLAKARQTNNDAAGVRNAKIGPQTDAHVNAIGVGGEIAFAKMFNAYPDLTTHPRKGGIDCRIGPYAIDVKTTDRPGGKLLAVTSKTLLAADVYALMIAAPPRYGFCGFARAGDLLHPSRLINLGHGPGYALDQVDLRPDLPINASDIHWS